VDEDTTAFNKIMDAFRKPNKSENEKQERKEAIEEATKNAIMVPFKVMETALGAFEVLKAMAETGNPNSVSDAGVGVLAIRSCVIGAFLNVKINASGLDDKEFVETILQKGKEIEIKTKKFEKEILNIIEGKL
ncbi:MAG: cyclodeaminase/cyclohydrolase family protein, partial [Bacteroidales bacterium]|nr:cyclodeaminase/cyclohydrolase family protein [Bacteroidales bacterium]